MSAIETLRRDVEKEMGFACEAVRRLALVEKDVPQVQLLATAVDEFLTYRTGYTREGVPVRQ